MLVDKKTGKTSTKQLEFETHAEAIKEMERIHNALDLSHYITVKMVNY